MPEEKIDIALRVSTTRHAHNQVLMIPLHLIKLRKQRNMAVEMFSLFVVILQWEKVNGKQ